MSAEQHAFWPQPGSVWRHASDLFLACQLAALRSGFSKLNPMWGQLGWKTYTIRRFFTPGKQHSLVGVAPIAPAGSWQVVSILVVPKTVTGTPANAPGASGWLSVRAHTVSTLS